MPGFIESHVHLLNYAYSLTKIDCAPMKSLKELVEASREYIREKQIPLGTLGAWKRLEPDLFRGEEKSHDCGSDAVSTEHPIVFTRVCEHMVVANSMALSLAGITKGQRKSGGRRN